MYLGLCLPRFSDDSASDKMIKQRVALVTLVLVSQLNFLKGYDPDTLEWETPWTTVGVYEPQEGGYPPVYTPVRSLYPSTKCNLIPESSCDATSPLVSAADSHLRFGNELVKLGSKLPKIILSLPKLITDLPRLMDKLNKPRSEKCGHLGHNGCLYEKFQNALCS